MSKLRKSARGQERPGLMTHGKSRSKAYRIWDGMRQRCDNPKNKAYKNYGGRGIRYCPKWQFFEGFYEDMGDPPDGSSLDRIDNEGNYEPSNCRWATRIEQNNNSRQNTTVSFCGETLTIAQWARRIGVRANTLSLRLLRGWPVEAALTRSCAERQK